MSGKALAAVLATVLVVVVCAVCTTALLGAALAACTTTLTATTAAAPTAQPAAARADSFTVPASASGLSPCPGPQPCPRSSITSSVVVAAGCLPGPVVLARAATWLTAWHGGPVPYLSSGDPTTWLDGYRRDCSGYASMALGLPGPGLDTAALAAHSAPISKADLLAGDLLINPAPASAGHVVIFEHWTDATTASYLGYEQSGDAGTHHRVIPYPYFGGYPMSPYRYLFLASSISRQPPPRDR
jgi:hypothetical protein